MLEVTVKKVRNGFILRWEEEYLDSPSHTFHAEEYVIEDTGEAACGCQPLIATMYEIIDQLGLSGSKHDKHRVRVMCKCQEPQQGEQTNGLQ